MDSFTEYQESAARTLNQELDSRDQILNVVLGLNGEAGEFADGVKKVFFQGHDEDREKFLEELGDVLWYVAGIATVYGFGLGDVAEYNIKKLKERYPSGFSKTDSVNRLK